MRDVVGDEVWANIEPHLNIALSGVSVPLERQRVNRLGEPVWHSGHHVPDVNDDGDVVGVYTVFFDTSQRALAEQALRHSEQELRAAKAAAENASNAKSELDANRKVIADGAADLVRELKEGKAQWLYLPPDSFLGTLAQDVIIPAAMETGLPTFASTEQLMQAGALTGLVSRYYSVGQFTAHKAEQILVGKQAAATIPIETLKRFSYQVRISAAERLKLPPQLPMLNYAEIITDAPIAQ